MLIVCMYMYMVCKECVSHPKESTISEDVDHAMDVGLAGEVESGTYMSTWSDDNVFGEPRVQTMI